MGFILLCKEELVTKSRKTLIWLEKSSSYPQKTTYKKETKGVGWNEQDRKKLSAYQALQSAADVKMVIPVLVQSLKSSILSSTSFQMGKTFWVVVSAAVESNLGVKPTWLLRETGNSALEADPRIPPNQKKKQAVPSLLLNYIGQKPKYIAYLGCREQFAQGIPKVPLIDEGVQGCERDSEQTHQHIRQRHVGYEDVGRRLHGLVPGDDQDDQRVAEEPDDEDDEVEEAEEQPDPEVTHQELVVADDGFAFGLDAAAADASADTADRLAVIAVEGGQVDQEGGRHYGAGRG